MDTPPANDPANQEILRRFAEAARRGSRPAASHGEVICHRLAAAIHKIGDDLALLDMDLIRAACLLLHAAHGPWKTDRQKETCLGLIRHAAAKD